MESININVTSEQKQFLDSLNNYSDWIREAIDDKRGKREQSIQELEIEALELANKIEEIELKHSNAINNLLEHRQQLRLSEIDELEAKKQHKEQTQQDFMAKWSPILSTIPEIQNVEMLEGWEKGLMPLIEKLRSKDIKIGYIQLRDYLLCASKSKSALI